MKSLNKEKLNSKFSILICAGVFLLALAAGVWFINYAGTGMHREKLGQQVERFAQLYIDDHSISGGNHVGVGYVYDDGGNLVYQFGRDGFFELKEDLVEHGWKNARNSLNGNDNLVFEWFVPNGSTLGYTSLMFNSAPVWEDGRVVGVLCYINENADFLETEIGYVVIITLVFAAITVIMIIHNRSILKYEQAQKNYIDNVTHELKTPVASIKALAEALSDDMVSTPAERNVHLGMILREANRQERMIRNILQLSKLQGDYGHVIKKRASSAEVFDDVCQKYESICDLMEIEFNVSDEIKTMPDMDTDPDSTSQVLEILLDNAIKFVGAEAGQVELSAVREHKKAIVCVSDNGIGIKESEISHIGERFYRGSNARTYRGSGLGLAIARELICKLNEKIWIESKEGEGTKVYFTVSLK